MRMTGIMLLLLVLLQACGHKGALYLPQAPATSSQFDQNK